MTTETTATTAARRLAMVVRDLVDRETFETEADLREALKVRATRYRLPWTRETLDRAIALVASNRAIVMPPRREPPPPVVEAPPFSKSEAEIFLDRLMREFGFLEWGER